ncbi:MAG: hypothetical protein JW725_02340 [Candidatus Babeliaceae bacterium]|nr:hypothetical protein [Candidatus Babeliaceae bacterium]
MKQLRLPVILILGLMSMGVLSAREIRTPLPLQTGWYMYYPVSYHWERERCEGDCWSWETLVEGMGYYRSSDVAFSTCDGTNKVPWVNLIFGKSDFTLAEAFPNATVPVTALPNNPWVSISTISPRFEYREAGAMFFASCTGFFDWCDATYRLGVRGRLPVRDIEVSDVCNVGNLEGETLHDVWRQHEETPGAGVTDRVFAGRLDFISHLARVVDSTVTPMVNFHTSTNHIEIAGQAVDSAVSDVNGTPYVAGIYSADQSFPAVPWGKIPSTIDGLISAGGSVSGDRNRFVSTTDYTALGADATAQSTLFIVPSITSGLILPGPANTIRNAIDAAILGIDDSIIDFYEETGLSFCNGRTKGAGDLDVDLYFGRNWCNDDIWTDVSFGIRFPTAKEWCTCLELLKQPAGNNKHYEARLGIAGGWDMHRYVKLMADFTYNWVIKHRERLAAPFYGATVKNIGPCIDAEVKWDYLVAHIDLTFFANDCCGFDVGYEAYYKRCDNICLCQTTARDFANRIDQRLDASVLTQNTNRVAHKVRTGFFTQLGDCSVAGGWSQVVAGKNCPRDTDWYLKLGVRF